MLLFFSRILSLARVSAGLAPPRPFVLGLGALVVLAAAVLGLLLTAGPAPSTQAAADIGTIAIDTDITGNTVTPCTATGNPNLDYPCNNSTVLGSIQNCASITVGQSIQIDVVGIGIPAGGTNGSDQDFQGAGYSDMALNWSPSGVGTSPIAVTARDFTVALIHQGDNDNGAQPGTNPVGTNASGESGHWRWSDVDANNDLVAEGGQGIAVRLTITGVLTGTTTISLGANNLSVATWTDIHGNEYTVGQNDGATIVVGGACPTTTPVGQTPSPTPTPTPIGQTPSPSPSPTVIGVSQTPAPIGPPIGGLVALPIAGSSSAFPWTPLAAVAASVMAVFGAGSWYARRRWLR